MDTKPTETAQDRFDATYISSTDIMEKFSVSRTAIMYARRRGMLPDPVTISGHNIYIWERTSVQPYLDAWGLQLAARRGELA